MLSGSIRQRSPGHWEIRIDAGRDNAGKRIRHWRSVKGTKKDAVAEKNRLIRILESGTSLSGEKLTCREFLRRWLSDYAATRVSNKTLQRYSEICELHLIPHFGNLALSKLEPLHIQTAYAKMLRDGRVKGGPLSGRTVLHHHRVLRQALSQAVAWKLLQRNPADLIDAPRAKKAVVCVYDEAQAHELLVRLSGSDLHLPVAIALHTGMRRGEILALRWSDIDFERLQIQVSRSLEQVKRVLTVKGTKTGKSRTISIGPALIKVLRSHKAQQNTERLGLGEFFEDNDLVYSGPDGTPKVPHCLSDAFRAAKRRITQLPSLTFHGLRHTHATILLRNGIHIKVVSERMGHSSVAITLEVYGHVIPGMQEKAAEEIDRALSSF